MKPERWQELDRLFQLAVERAPSERAAFLDDVCGDDQSLHKQIEELLAAYEGAGSFIEKPALEVEARSFASDQDELGPGQTVGHYKIVSPLGAGGMGNVYLAQDTVLGRKLALKLLPDCFTQDPNRLRRFEQEARAASALNHPNIVTTYEIGRDGPFHFIAEEFIDGVTLRDQMSGRRLELNEALDIATQVASALASAHEKGIVHRDIKPENIMVANANHILGRQNHVKILDFGIAKLTEPSGSMAKPEATTRLLLKTQEGSAIGTAPYMSPEQTRGESVDARADIWSFGVVLYEMLTGAQPFNGVTPQDVSASILKDDLSPLPSEFPEGLKWIVKKSLRKDQEDRYQTARELFSDLRDLQTQGEADGIKHATALRDDAHAAAQGNNDFTSVRLATSAEYLVSEVKQDKRIVITGLFALILAAAGAAYFLYFAPTAKAIDSIAVLPLVNVSGDPNTEYLSDGISEALINSLTELRQLRVMARATAFRYKGKDLDPQAVGRDLKVKAVLMGRVRQMGETLNIQVDLVDTATGAQLWGQEYERKVSEVLLVKQAIAREVTEKLRLRLSGEQQQQLTKRDTSSSEAYQFYLRGRYFWNKRTAENIRKAIEQFQQAADKDPNYALAYVGLADCYLVLEEYASVPWSESRQKATEAVERALQLDDSLAEAHASLAMVNWKSWQWNQAEDEFKRAIALNPNYPTAHQWYGITLRMLRRLDESMQEMRRAQELDPLSAVIQLNVVAELFIRGDVDAAAAICLKLIEFDPNYPLAHGYMGWIYQTQARYQDAITELQKWVDLSGRQSEPLGALGQVYALAGQREKATAILAELEQRYARRETNALPIASVYAGMRDYEKCFAWLEKDFQTRSGMLPYITYRPTFDIVRSHPGYVSLLERTGLTQFIKAHENK